MTGYTKEDISVELTKGSVKATVTITPKAGSDSAALKTMLTTQKADTESAVLDKVKAMPAAVRILEDGKSLSDLTVTSTAPIITDKGTSTGKGTSTSTGKGDDAASDARSESRILMAVMATAAMILA